MGASILYCDNCGAANTPNDTYCGHCKFLLQATISAGGGQQSGTGRLAARTILKQRYRVLTSIGRGGMGAVYLAEDMQLGDRRVAVKEMSQAQLDPTEVQDAVRGFQQEAHLLAGLGHPNLPSIHDHFEQNGRWYLVMSYIDGETLEDYLDHKPGKKLPLRETLQIGLDLCKVLAYLHSHRPPIIFRDLKPTNIMRTHQGHIYLIDFGIARFFKPGQLRDTASYGSAGYAPPEQYGRAQTTTRSDIYSLGATLFHLLTGYHPSNAPFRLPPLLSLEPTLPRELGDLITQMLKLDEDERPATIAEVEQELDQMLQWSSGRILRPQSSIPPTQPSSSGVGWTPPPARGQVQSFASIAATPVIRSSSPVNVWGFSRWRFIATLVGTTLCAIGWSFSYSVVPYQFWHLGGADFPLNSFLAALVTAFFFFIAALSGPWAGLLIGIFGTFLFYLPYMSSMGSYWYSFVFTGLQGLFIGWMFLRLGRKVIVAAWILSSLFVAATTLINTLLLSFPAPHIFFYAFLDLCSLALATLFWNATKRKMVP